MNFQGHLLNQSRLLTILHDNLPDEIKTSELYGQLAGYLEKYANFNSITVEKTIEIYTNFITAYNKHCKYFIKSSLYPQQNEVDFSINREEYDIVLLLSVLFTPHRFRIMQLLEQQLSSEKALFIGMGPGIELFLTKEKHKEIHAYDLSISKFLFSEFNNVRMKSELYTGQYENYFDAIYLIEILEHLEDPFKLLDICSHSVIKGGKIYLTTATDIPQFDHLYNFTKDHINFEAQLKKMEFKIIYKEIITHNYLTLKLNACNHFYVLQKI